MPRARVLGDAKPSTLGSSPQEDSDQQRILTCVHTTIIYKVEDDRKDLGINNFIPTVEKRSFLTGGNREGFLKSEAFNVCPAE